MNQAPQTSSASPVWARIGEQWAKRGRLLRIKGAIEAVAIGNDLRLLKSVSPHGTFIQQITAFGISHRTACRYMAVASWFHQAPESFMDAVGSASKLFELTPVAKLMGFSEKAVTAAHPNGHTVVLPFAQLALMSTKEIREAVRELQRPLAASSKQVSTAPMPSEALAEEEQVLLQRYRQCPQAAQSCLQLMAGLLVTSPS